MFYDLLDTEAEVQRTPKGFEVMTRGMVEHARDYYELRPILERAMRTNERVKLFSFGRLMGTYRAKELAKCKKAIA